MVDDWAAWAAVLLGAGLIALGAAGFAAPELVSRSYGIVVEPGNAVARAWAWATAWRDVAVGAMVAAGALWASRDLAGALVLAAALIPAGDAVVLARHGIRTGRAYVLHVGGALVMTAVGAVLLAR